jgi:hypothetical protein
MEIVISERLKRQNLTLEKVMNHPRMKYFYCKVSDTKGPRLVNGHLIILDTMLDMYFMVVTQECVSELCGFSNPSDVNIILDLNGEVVELR